jgi:hypothetical protein
MALFTEELAFATKRSLRSDGNLIGSQILDHACDPAEAVHVQKLIYEDIVQRPYSADEALALLISANLTRERYNLIREDAMQKGHNLYPSYSQVRKAKEDCYPKTKTVTETGAKVELQNLLNHTSERILKTLPILLPSVTNLVLVCKWGCDGASGHSQYKQALANPKDSDSSIFLSCLVSLKLYNEVDGAAVWTNPRPSSTRYCRPIKFDFVKETEALLINRN